MRKFKVKLVISSDYIYEPSNAVPTEYQEPERVARWARTFCSFPNRVDPHIPRTYNDDKIQNVVVIDVDSNEEFVF